MNTPIELQKWYFVQCNEEWEHHNGINIETLDNPGWKVTIDLHQTSLEHAEFKPVMKNVSKKFYEQAVGEIKPPFICEEPISKDWLLCFVKDGPFDGAGAPARLEEILTIFLNWVKNRE